MTCEWILGILGLWVSNFYLEVCQDRVSDSVINNSTADFFTTTNLERILQFTISQKELKCVFSLSKSQVRLIYDSLPRLKEKTLAERIFYWWKHIGRGLIL